MKRRVYTKTTMTPNQQKSRWSHAVRSLVLLSVMLVAVTSIFLKPKLPHKYESKSAKEKQNILWNIIKSKSGTQSRFPGPLLQLKSLTENFRPTADHYGDDVPYYHNKRIHTVGAVVTTQFVITNTENNPFTGIFQTGSMYGLSRLSIAGKASNNKFSPGIAVKFLRSNSKPSANFVAMISLEGQQGGNYFRNEFQNHIPKLSADASFFLKLGVRKFKQVSNDPFKVGLSDIGKYYENGTAVEPTKSMNFPFQIVLVPNPTLTALFSTVSNEDQLRRVFTSKIPANTTLYTIYGIESPTNKDRILIGELIATSKPIYSKWGDEFLFFRHQRMEEDIKLRPEWKNKDRRLSEDSNDSRKHIRKSRKLQHLLDGMAQNTRLASIHANVSTSTDTFTSLCAFAHLM
jgi:hypothetical protein